MYDRNNRTKLDKARKRSNDTHKNKLDTRTKTWGSVKFKPQAYRSSKPAFTPPNPQATAKPWQHVKNDIIDDSEELSHAGRLDVDSKDARQFMQQREQNHRRNIIETNRSEPTKWETFDDDQPSTSKGKKGERSGTKSWECEKPKRELPTDVNNFTFKERNFYRRKLTMGLKRVDAVDLEGAINDLRRNKSQLERATATFKEERPELTTNQVKKGGGGNPFQKRPQSGRKFFQKKRKGKKSWEE